MISERQFLRGYRQFWRECFPDLEKFTRSLQARGIEHPTMMRWAEPFKGSTSSHWNDIIAEIAFNAFARSTNDGLGQTIVTEPDIESAIVKMGLIRGGALERSEVTTAILNDANAIASRLARFFGSQDTIQIHPHLQGLGILNSIHPDVFADNTIFEIKASGNSLKREDIKQILTYFLLGLLNEMPTNKLCLLNPRRGTCFTLKVEQLPEWLGAPSHASLKERFRKTLED